MQNPWEAYTISKMTKNNPLLKKRIAKEILFFFGAVGLVGLVWGFLLLRNNYYDNKKTSLKVKISSLTHQLGSLQKDKIKSIYEGFNQNFVVNYKVMDESYAIPKKEEQEFLNDYSTAIKQANYTSGYSYFKLKSVPSKQENQ